MRSCFVPRRRPASTERDDFSVGALAIRSMARGFRAVGAVRRASALGFDLVFCHVSLLGAAQLAPPPPQPRDRPKVSRVGGLNRAA